MGFRWEHMDDCIKLLGDPYDEVHAWLDAKVKEFPINKYGDYHRRFRHNKEGLEFVRKHWGEKAEIAAKIHIYRDAFNGIFENELEEIIAIVNKLLRVEDK